MPRARSRRTVAKRRQASSIACAPLGDRGLPHDTGRALEGMREPQQPLDRAAVAAAFLDIEDALRELIEQIARLGAEIAVRVLHHGSVLPGLPRHAAICGLMMRNRSRDSVAISDTVCSVWPALVSVSLDAWVTLATATLTCSTAVDLLFGR